MTTPNLLSTFARSAASIVLIAGALAGCATQSGFSRGAGATRRRCADDAQQFHPRSRPDMDPGQPQPGQGGADRSADRPGRLHLRRFGRQGGARRQGRARVGRTGLLQSGDCQRGLSGRGRRLGSHHRRDDGQGAEFAAGQHVQGRRRCEHCRGSGGCRCEVHDHCRSDLVHAGERRVGRRQSRRHGRQHEHPVERRLFRREQSAAAGYPDPQVGEQSEGVGAVGRGRSGDQIGRHASAGRSPTRAPNGIRAA